MTEVTLRPATTADVPRLSELVRAAYGHYVERLGGPPRPMTDDYADVVRSRRVIVAERTGEIAGLVVMGVDDEGFFIDNVAVDPAHQGIGVGKALLEHAEVAARDAGFASIHLFTHTLMTESLALYTRIGYVEYDRRLHGGAHIVYLRKSLPTRDKKEQAMRKIINSTYISLDGVIERPHEWPPVGERGSRGDEIVTELLRGCDVLIMGRRTYEVFAPVWPTRSGDAYSDRINSMRKYVVSSTLTDPEWNNASVISDDPVAEIKRLKEAEGKDIVQYGFGQLSHALLAHGLLDELHLWVHPLFVGNAEPSELIYRDGPGAMFDLVDTTSLQNGIVILSYRTREES